MKQCLIFLTLGLISTSCAQFNRSTDSGYGARSPKVITSYAPTSSSGMDSETVRTAYELGLSPNNMTPDEAKQVQQRRQVKGLERGLESRQEKDQYSKILPWFKDDEEKISFLSIPSLEGRQQWINKNNIWSRARVPANRMKDLIDAQDIAVGMPMEYVRRAWGDPVSVESSGNPIYKNARWKYIRNVPGADGFHQQKRFVYFESGRVVGWDTE